MIKLKDCFSGKYRIILESVNYEFKGEPKGDFQLDYKDEFSIEEKNDSYLKILFKRKAYFEPECIFKIEVSYSVELLLSEEYCGNLNWENYNLEKEVNEDHEFYTCGELGRISCIISSITGSFENAPLITPPVFILGENTLNE